MHSRLTSNSPPPTRASTTITVFASILNPTATFTTAPTRSTGSSRTSISRLLRCFFQRLVLVSPLWFFIAYIHRNQISQAKRDVEVLTFRRCLVPHCVLSFSLYLSLQGAPLLRRAAVSWLILLILYCSLPLLLAYQPTYSLPVAAR
ncbi:hypothetical protein BOTBODRAFT_335651 [Botryobasidium botryosum FD-172 SS1]|uniref:Uncharacterized protein n=1 Tax=Botryobasidium botryosum (strain FD-172 SS1) TaxID=930990 RepID=A0A067MSQ1_BOTB1|nr:hypothetical protein BOTBODRAFT_335651 [Botryobasidium botryosum FD-172 SS1]